VDRLLLDANVLFSAAYRDASVLARLWQFADVELITSSYAAGEAERNLPTDAQRLRLSGLLVKMTIVAAAAAVDLPPGVTLPEKDVPILAAAIQVQATHLLTGDKTHFGSLFGKSIRGVLILSPASYFAIREDKSAEEIQ
jgi:predicted nucleic acid-binding protein